jgi:hypothetical protein
MNTQNHTFGSLEIGLASRSFSNEAGGAIQTGHSAVLTTKY